MTGVAIPFLLFGRTVFAVAVIIGFISLLFSDLRTAAWQFLKDQIRQPLGVAILLTASLWTISAFGSSFPLRSMEATIRTGLIVAAAAMFYAALRSDPGLQRRCVRFFIAASCACAAVAVLELTFVPQLFWFLRLKGWQDVPLDHGLKAYSALAIMMIPVLVLSARDLSGKWQVAGLVAALLMLIVVWENNNRAAVAGFLAMWVAIPLALFVGRGNRKLVLAFTLVSLCVVGGAVIRLYQLRGFIVDIVPGENWLFPVWLIDFERQAIWAHVIEIARQFPWFGVGANTINYTPGADAPLPGSDKLTMIPAHPHNWVVEILAETGVVGLISMIVAILAAFATFLRRYRAAENAGVLATIVIMAGYWASGLFNFSYWSAWWQISFLLAVAISASGCRAYTDSAA